MGLKITTKEQSASSNQTKGEEKEMKKIKEKGKEKTVYSHDEVVEASIQYFKGDELAARVWANKYAIKDSFGNLYEKSPDDMHWQACPRNPPDRDEI